ncbi:ABC transporter substrate-binding protein [Pullulanibacillus camelliae]|uniref:ABC transporter substrate-binding protein n=1 Tax=Pullulanibacillus camelliae TaxID=1707096 RepID=A0A8J2YFE4_9BACL|nr:ABC transporter substrate-binding protein [Pullulanibacillus camelliae]GGE28818.1 ABC transporter substrate-binding protein [Pullulanibacillus camelliae]
MKKVFVLTTIMIMVLFMALTGCSSSSKSSSSNDGGKTFTYWYPWGGDSEKWDKWRMGVFEKDHPGYKINSVYVPPDGGISNGKLMAAITGNNPPDVVVSNDYASAYALATQGALMPLDDLLKKADLDESSIIDTFKPLMKYKGKTYLFPEDSNVNLLYINKKLFKDAGLDPSKPPKTIAELDADAEKLSKVEGNGKIDKLGFIPWLDAGDDAFLWGWIFGANYFDTKTGKVEINNSQLDDMYKWEDSYAKKYNPEKIKSFTSGFGGAFSPNHPFFTGKVAMTVNGNWFSNAIKQYAPDIDYEVVPIPSPPNGREKATTFGTNVFMIPKNAKNPEAALKFILFGSQPKILADNINTWRSISIYKKSSAAIKWNRNGDAIYKVVKEVAESPNSGHPALTSVANEMSNDLNLLRDKVIYNDKDPGPLLKELQKKLQAEVDKKK